MLAFIYSPLQRRSSLSMDPAIDDERRSGLRGSLHVQAFSHQITTLPT